MRRFAIAAALATALGFGTAGTAAAQHGRFPMHHSGFAGGHFPGANMGGIRPFPSINTFPRFFRPNPFFSFAPFFPLGGFNTFIGPGFNFRTSTSAPFVIPFSPGLGIHRW